MGVCFYRKVVLFLSLSFFFFTLTATVEVTVIKDPKPTFKEGKPVPLEKVGEMKDPVNMDAFLAIPSSLTMDPRTENIYVYDAKQIKIFKYDKNLKMIKLVGQRGEGPGDIKTFRDSGTVYLQFANNRLYAYNDLGSKVMVFDRNLEFIDEIRHKPLNSWFAFAVDDCENYYFRNLRGGLWGLDRDMKVKWHLLEDIDVFKFLFFDPPRAILENPMGHRNIYLKFDVINGSTLLVYSRYTGQFFFFKDGRLTKTISLYSDYVLSKFRQNILKAFRNNERAQRRRIKRGLNKLVSFGYSDIYAQFFVDKVSGKHFYVQFSEWKTKQVKLYRFNLEGVLEKTYSFRAKAGDDYPFFKMKGKDTFYATTYESQILMFREQKK